MFEKFNQLAEQTASGVSRRRFLGRFGRGAMVAAAALGGMLAPAGDAHAARKGKTCPVTEFGECSGKPVGSPCSAGGDPGKCTSTSKGRTVESCWCKPFGHDDDRE